MYIEHYILCTFFFYIYQNANKALKPTNKTDKFITAQDLRGYKCPYYTIRFACLNLSNFIEVCIFLQLYRSILTKRLIPMICRYRQDFP